MRGDTAFQLTAGRLPESRTDRSSQPTLSRLENAVTARELKSSNRELPRTYGDKRPVPGKRIVIDADTPDDPTHNQQAFSFYYGDYRRYMFHPFLCFDAETGELLAAMLRPGNVHADIGEIKILKRIVKKIRKYWPGVEIVLRADPGFCVSRLYRFCEYQALGYVLGLIANKTLKQFHAPLVAQAQLLFASRQNKVRLMGEVGYSARRWKRFHRVVMKTEVMPQGTNRRFVVPNLEDEHRGVLRLLRRPRRRGKPHQGPENRPVRQPAVLLMHHLRRHLAGTELATASACAYFPGQEFPHPSTGAIPVRLIWPFATQPAALSLLPSIRAAAPAGVFSLVATVSGADKAHASATENATPGKSGTFSVDNVPVGSDRAHKICFGKRRLI